MASDEASEGGSHAGESIVDDTDRCFALLGNTQFWRNVDGEGYGGRLRWTYAFTAAQPGAYARWRLDFASAGRYEVAVYAEPAYSESLTERHTSTDVFW